MPRDNNTAYEPIRNAEHYGMKPNPDTGHVLTILSHLGENELKYGKPYCPCFPQHNESTVCPCRYMRMYHACRCGLYVQKDNNRKEEFS